jgi:hypothetical protein
MEELAAKSGKTLADVPRAQMEELWDTAKRAEKGVALASREARKA